MLRSAPHPTSRQRMPGLAIAVGSSCRVRALPRTPSTSLLRSFTHTHGQRSSGLHPRLPHTVAPQPIANALAKVGILCSPIANLSAQILHHQLQRPKLINKPVRQNDQSTHKPLSSESSKSSPDQSQISPLPRLFTLHATQVNETSQLLSSICFKDK